MSRIIGLAAISLLFAFLSANAQSSAPSTLKQLLGQARDEQDQNLSACSDAVKYFRSYHSRAELRHTIVDKNGRTTEIAHDRILVITWFLNDRGVAIRYSVSETGRVHDVLDIYNWASQAAQNKQLPKEDLTTLEQLIPRLPKSTAAPPVKWKPRTVYVSLKDNQDWRTETYDATKLPEEFEAVLRILGERLETRDRTKPQPQ